MEQIDSLQIHLWLAFLDEITDPRLLGEYRLLLSEEERQKQARFRFDRDGHRYLVTRAMVRTVLSRYAEVAPRQWRFETNEFGKPRVASEDAHARRLSFNVSHTPQVVLLAVTLDRALGVDVEHVRPERACVDIADRFFAPAEVQDLRALPHEQQTRRFFEYWTLKESYIKARGMGLAIPLDRFTFTLEETGRVRLQVDPSLNDLAERWHFTRLQPTPEHLVAVCREEVGDQPAVTVARMFMAGTRLELDATFRCLGGNPRPLPRSIKVVSRLWQNGIESADENKHSSGISHHGGRVCCRSLHGAERTEEPAGTGGSHRHGAASRRATPGRADLDHGAAH